MKEFSRLTQAYIVGIIILAGCLAVWQYDPGLLTGSWLLLAACVISALLQSTAVVGTTARSTYSLSWIVYAFVLVLQGTSAALLVIFMSHLVEWLLDRSRLAWYIQAFNVGNFFVVATISGLIIDFGQTKFASSETLSFITIVFALAVFTFLNHIFVAVVIKLARGQSFAESGVLGWFTLNLDFSLLCLGFTATIIWRANGIALTLIVFLTIILYQALKMPALERKTEIDPKTQLYNAQYFAKALSDELNRSERFNRPLSLIMADIDLLRNINNSYGHLAGDVVLQGIAKILQEMAREFDITARFGGEEFSILLPETEVEDALIVAEKIRQRIEATAFEISTSIHPIRATMSLGISGREGSEQTVNDLIHRADLALYLAKESGRNRACVYDDQVDMKAGEVQREWRKLEAVRKLGPAALPADDGNINQGKSNQEPTVRNGSRTPNTQPVTHSTLGTASGLIDVAQDNPSSARAFWLRYPKWSANMYIAGLSIFTAAFAGYLVLNHLGDINWPHILLFVIIILVLEAASIEIYVRDTTVSTSAALLVSGVLVFGAPAALVLGSVIAFVSFVKQSSKMIQFLFNCSNHILGGLIIAALLNFIKVPIEAWSLPGLLVGGVGMAGSLFLSSTFLLAIAIGLSNNSQPKRIWLERFQWLVPYYLALGLVAGVLVFSYLAINMTGVLIVLMPLLMLRYSQKQYIDHTESLVQSLQDTNSKLELQANEIAQLNEELLLTLACSVDLRDPHVMEHSKHVSRYAVVIAEELGLSSDQIETVRKAGLLHDIGKLGIPESILFKPSRLTPGEYELVKKHVTIGAELLQASHLLQPLAPFVLHHHEWFNGNGYPDGLAGDEIPIEARILCLADTVETMASDRPYKQALPPSTILEELRRCAGTQFDPVLIKAFERIIESRGSELIVNSSRLLESRQNNSERAYVA